MLLKPASPYVDELFGFVCCITLSFSSVLDPKLLNTSVPTHAGKFLTLEMTWTLTTAF